MNAAKIQLSAEELSLVQNAHWLLTKNTIIEKVYTLFGDIAHQMRDNLNANPAILLSEVLIPSPKISRGENYGGLPWVMLDYPRLFNRQDTFAIRTMFWWGHYFSVTLHLKGEMQKVFGPALNRHTKQLAAAGFHMATEGDEWRHELEGGHYIPVTEGCYDPGREYAFVKLSATIPLDKWEKAPELLPGLSRMLLQVLTN